MKFRNEKPRTLVKHTLYSHICLILQSEQAVNANCILPVTYYEKRLIILQVTKIVLQVIPSALISYINFASWHDKTT